MRVANAKSEQMSPILTYEYIQYGDPADAFRPYDERSPAVAARVASLIQARMPDAVVEHVGSSAVPGCAGKGVVDLMVNYPPGRLDAARAAVDGLGFQRQANKDPFPEERPLRVGAIEHDGAIFRMHVHVIAADSPETVEQLGFRDALRSDPELMREYVELKRQVLASGASDNVAYNRGKQDLIWRVLGRESAPENER
jgi:GrpB-like predicted nucleotidyltransferase (UPF0157 family)